MSIDYAKLFQEELLKEVAEQERRSPEYAPSEWIVTGRASKKYPNKENLDWWLENGPEMLAAYDRWRKQSGYEIWVTPDGETAVELDLKVDMGGYKLRAIIDRVELNIRTGELVIMDIKSGSRKPVDGLQLATYRVALEKAYGVRASYGAYYMARTASIEERDLSAWTDARVDKAYRDFLTAEAQGLLIPNEDHFCAPLADYCVFHGGKYADQVPDF